jgi:hypothetical protein
MFIALGRRHPAVSKIGAARVKVVQEKRGGEEKREWG